MEHIDGFRITHLQREPYFTMKEPHFHPWFELYYLVSGTRRIFVDHTAYTLNKGDLVFIWKGAIHKTTFLTNGVHERIALFFSEAMLEDLLLEPEGRPVKQIFESPVLRLNPDRQKTVEGLLNRIEQEADSRDRFYTHSITGLIRELVIFLIRIREWDDQSGLSPLTVSDGLMQKAALYAAAHFRQSLTLNAAAEQVSLSPAYFSRRFKKTTGFGYHEYLTHLRLREAARMLMETDLSVTEIAIGCGFNDSNYFGDLFKKTLGLSPTAYRKKAKNM